ncbi:MAG: hypothetical protein ABFS05_02685 [Bacteroidota bacterium]
MKRFDSRGMLIIPNPVSTESICKSKQLLLIKECYCQNGHNLISNKAIFNGFAGIVILVRRGDEEGLVALSPVYGYKSRVSLNVDLFDEQIWDICCPQCNATLPVYSSCACGGNMIALFTNTEANFANCIGICNRIGCYNAGIQHSNELLTQSMIQELPPTEVPSY